MTTAINNICTIRTVGQIVPGPTFRNVKNEVVEILRDNVGKIVENGLVLVNDHRADGATFACDGLAITSNGFACPICKGKVQCLNYTYVGADGKAHLSTTSIGGNIDCRTRTVDEAIEYYNASMAETTFVPEDCKTFVVGYITPSKDAEMKVLYTATPVKLPPEVDSCELNARGWTKSAKQILKALALNGGKVAYEGTGLDADDPLAELLGTEPEIHTFCHFAVLDNGVVAPLVPNTSTMISEIYLDDEGKPWLHNYDCGLAVNAIKRGLHYALEEYNLEMTTASIREDLRHYVIKFVELIDA